MNHFEIFLIAIALSLDAFSVSISCGIKLKSNHYQKFLKISLFFGVFQAVMPIIGYILSNSLLKEMLKDYANWIAFTVFMILGLKTITDHFIKKEISDEGFCCMCDGYKCLISMSIATSIDALLIGFVLGIQDIPLVIPIIAIGVITFINSLLGCFLGNRSVSFLGKRAQIIAGLILIMLAIKAVL